MKNVALALLLLVSVTACNNQSGKKAENKEVQTVAVTPYRCLGRKRVLFPREATL